MQLTELRAPSRVVVQAHVDDQVHLCASELIHVEHGQLVIRALDELPTDMEGQPVTLLVSGNDCLLRVTGSVTQQSGQRIHVDVEREVEELQRRRFARLTGWLPVQLVTDDGVHPGTLVDASIGGAAVLTSATITPETTLALRIDGADAHAVVVGLTALDTGIRRLHLKFDEGDDATGAVIGKLLQRLDS